MQSNINTPQGTPFKVFSMDDVATYYNFPGNNGEGVTVGILAWGAQGTIGVDIAAVTKFLTSNGKSAPVFNVNLIGGQVNNNATSGELHMDTTVMGWYVPGAIINIYIAEEATVATAINQAVADGCSVTTCSFGINDNAYVEDISAALVNAANNNVTTCFAAGDSGAGSGMIEAVVFPAGHPNALAVGGTFIPTGNPPQPTTCGSLPLNVEQVWWNYPTGKNAKRPWWSSGGGVSSLFAVPNYQASLNPTSFPVNGNTYNGRGVPDVAAFAQGNNGWDGTSVSTPTFASLIARINSALNTQVGDIHDIIYSLSSNAGAFNSITQGCNVPPAGQKGAGNGYTAQQGWDACTGLGTPDGMNLMTALRNALSIKK